MRHFFAPGQASSNTIIGIDLRTTNSLVGGFQDGQARLIPNALGELLTPSAVSIDAQGCTLVGQPARRARGHGAGCNRHGLQALDGHRAQGGAARPVGGREFGPEELSALVLGALKADAEAFLGHEVTEALITVPAYISMRPNAAPHAWLASWRVCAWSACSTSPPQPVWPTVCKRGPNTAAF